MEAFALAADRKKSLEQLVPGTEDYYYYHCLFHEQNGEHAAVEKLLAQWSQHYGESTRVQEIRGRHALLTWETDPEKNAELVRLRLGITFTHQKQSESSEAKYPSALDARWIHRDAFTAKSMTPDMRQFNESSFDWLLADIKAPDRLRAVLQRVRHPIYQGLVAAIARDLAEKNSAGFGGLPIHDALTRAQLEELVELMPSLKVNARFVAAYLTKLRPSVEDDWENVTPARRAYLETLWSYVQTLPVAFNSIKAHVLYHRLDLDRREGLYDRARFVSYLALPRRTTYAREPAVAEHAALVDFSAGVPAAKLARITNDEPLLADYLRFFFREGESYKAFSSVLSDDYVKPIYAETRLLYGIGDLEASHPLLGNPGALQKLKERVEISFALTSKEHYLADDEVALDVEVKNVETLVVKIFQINTLNYFLEHKRDVTTDIDLDGLVPAEETVHHFSEPALRRVPRRLVFPSLKRPGVYVIELIGNGRSSRALIRKGALRYIERASAAGQVVHLLDERGRVLKDGSILVAGRELRAKEDGAIYLPFAATGGDQRVLLRSGGVDTVVTFVQQTESYSFRAGIYVDREGLIAGKEAQVLVRPTLVLGGAFMPLALLEDLRLTIETTDRQGTTSTKDASAESFTFQCPAQLARVTFSVRGKVKAATTGRHIEVSDSCTYSLDDIDASAYVEDLHLARTDAGYVLSLLGKSGEPCPNRHVTVTFAHRDFSSRLVLTLQTDEEGRLQLGSLTDITWLSASAGSLTEQWTLGSERVRWPEALHAGAKETLSVPMLDDVFFLLEARGGTYVRDATERAELKDGFLNIKGLSPGDYVLFLRERQISLSVSSGVKVGNNWVHPSRTLTSPRTASLHIPKIKVEQDRITAQVVNGSAQTQVHVFGTRYVPSYDLFCAMTRQPDASARVRAQKPLPSQYLSGRDIGDEYRYILDRKAARKFAGILQPRPGLLLNPWNVRKTETRVQAAAGGDFFGRVERSMDSGGARGDMPELEEPAPQAANPFFANLDFLARPAVVMLSLTLGADGSVSVPRGAFASCNQVRFVAVHGGDVVLREVALPECREGHADKRLLLALDPQQALTEKKQTTVLAAGSALEIADITTSKTEAYDTLAKVHGLFSALSKNPLLQTFSFVTQWNKLPEAERCARYSELACHELSFFISRKDPAFFARVVAPYLANKKDKTFLDHYLLDADLSAYLLPWAFAQLNVVERILLAGRVQGEGSKTSRHIADRLALIAADLQQRAHFFRTALSRSALDTDDGIGLRQATAEAQSVALASFATMAGGMPAPPPPPAAAPAPMPRRPGAPQAKKESARANDSDEGGGQGGDLEMDMEERETSRAFSQALDKTEEWAENHYYRLQRSEQNEALVTVNAFWRDFAARAPSAPFLSASFPEASRNFTEMMFALSVLDLPFDAERPEATFAAKQMIYNAKSPSVVFHQEIKPARPADARVPVLVSQNYFDVNDRFVMEDGEQRDKYVTGEMLVRTVYQCQVVLTNPTSTRQKLELLLQIPRGSMPVQNGFETKGMTLHLEPYATQAIDYSFYFPLPGEFTHYPANVTKNEELIAAATVSVLKVVKELSTVDQTSWDYVSQRGTSEEVLRFLSEQNIDRVALAAIAWRMRDRAFFSRVLQALASRHVYDHTLWSYALHHRDLPSLREYLQHCSHFVAQLGPVLDSAPLTIDPVARGSYEHFEYAPFVSARAHKLGAERKILNDRLSLQYVSFMNLLAHKRALDDADWLAVAYYSLLQDRHDDGLAALQRVSREKVSTKLQYDYLSVYAAQLAEQPDQARRIAASYLEHPVPRWRDAFKNAVHQLDEALGGSAQVADDKDRDQRQGQLASTEPSFDFTIEAKTITIDYRNLSSVQVSYYMMDIELLFSRQPFVQQGSARFSFITPNHAETVALPEGATSLKIEVPEKFKSANLIVELSANGVRKSQSYFAHSLAVQVLEGYGQVAVSEQGSNRPVPKTYVKVYARMKDGGGVQFYKDGYTDLRGRMDYASLSTNELDRTETPSPLARGPPATKIR